MWRCAVLLLSIPLLAEEKVGYRILEDRLTGGGSCFNCRQPIPGVWRAPAI